MSDEKKILNNNEINDEELDGVNGGGNLLAIQIGKHIANIGAKAADMNKKYHATHVINVSGGTQDKKKDGVEEKNDTIGFA
ncbi:hypothetical protein QYZ88_006685 [Lachnospiraceae bacterium C1.1]|nr:hypothetical protein [Lachnospiraceae bacterium C1.1]